MSMAAKLNTDADGRVSAPALASTIIKEKAARMLNRMRDHASNSNPLNYNGTPGKLYD